MTNVKTIQKTAIEWIEVKDRLPEPDNTQLGRVRNVLICTKDGIVGETRFYHYAKCFGKVRGEIIPLDEIVAWAYMPKPQLNFDYSSIVDVQLNVTNTSTPEGDE